MSKLVEALVAQLEREREVTVQVADYLNGTYDVDRDSIGAFLTDKLPDLEDYEHDLILSPLFTPKLADQAIFADILGSESVPREHWPGLLQELASRPTIGHLVTTDKKVLAIPLREVTLERYVHRLRLDGTIPELLSGLIDRIALAGDRPLLKAVARRGIWDNDSRREILVRYLTSSATNQTFQLSDAIHLLDITESYKPANRASLLAMIPPWQETLRHEIDTSSGSSPFFTPQTQGEHGGDRDQRRPSEGRVQAKRNELATLDRLHQILAG
jgi:hypothetical protein